MPKLTFIVALLLCSVGGLASTAFSQAVPAYKITAIRVTPFDGSSGTFSPELAPVATGGYFNDLDKSLLVLVEVTGKAGEYVAKRSVSIRVTEGRKVKTTRAVNPGVMSENGKFYVPVWLYGPMCDTVTITASMTGQTARSSMTRKLDFMCGE